jgi:adenosylcobyric acid synthase
MKSIVVLGTSSNVGKSTIAMVICRQLQRQRKRVTPFKAHNISNSIYLTEAGHRIPYAQALQAWAAGQQPSLTIAPILLEPFDGSMVEATIGGTSMGKIPLVEFFNQYRDQNWNLLKSCLSQLKAQYDVVVCEGSGNPVDVGLEGGDLANLQVARYLDANSVLVVDGGRGGAIPHAIGTLELMEPDDRQRIKGLIVNKFDGSPELLRKGLDWFEQRTQIPTLGVIPRHNELFNSLKSIAGIARRTGSGTGTSTGGGRDQNTLTIAVIRLPHTASFADFDPLEAEVTVTVKYVQPSDTLGYPDAVILPGTRNTIADLKVLQESGMAQQICDYAAAGGTTLGILGGYHMLGETISDPEGIEGIDGRHTALGILAVKTVIVGKRIARQRSAISVRPQAGLQVSGYEFHQTRTQMVDTNAVKSIFDEPGLGTIDRYDAVCGINLHGIFDNGPWRRTWLNRLRQQRGFKALPTGIGNHRAQREEAIDRITDEFAKSLDLSLLFRD